MIAKFIELYLHLFEWQRRGVIGHVAEVAAGAGEVALFHDTVRGAAGYRTDASQLLWHSQVFRQRVPPVLVAIRR